MKIQQLVVSTATVPTAKYFEKLGLEKTIFTFNTGTNPNKNRFLKIHHLIKTLYITHKIFKNQLIMIIIITRDKYILKNKIHYEKQLTNTN